MKRKFRVEAFSGNTLVIETEDADKDHVIVRLEGSDAEIKVRIKEITDDAVFVEVGGDVFKVHLTSEGILVNGENSLVNRIVEILPIGVTGKISSSGPGKVTYRKGEIRAPLSGKINEVKVKPGDHVKVGDVVVLMESMKMITEVKSDVEGIVEEVLVEPGKAVNKDTLLVRIKPIEEKEKD